MDINITVTEIIAETTISETVITCDVVMSMESDVDKAYVDNQLDLKVDKVENHSLVPDTEIDKLAGIEENANNYTHPETHPASILDVVDVVNGDANKFLNERGEMVAVKHESLTDKNSEAAFQHVDTTTVKNTLVEGDKVAILDSATSKLVLTPKSNFGSQLLVDYTHTANKEVNVESIDFVTSVITATNHGLANNTQLFIANKLAANVLYPVAIIPTGLNTGTTYFVVNKTDNTFQVSLTSGGAAVAITDKATKDYTKWHFERKAIVRITNLANLKKCLIKTFGKCFDVARAANYIIFVKSGTAILGSTNTVWMSTGGRYSGNVNARSLLDLTSKGDLFSANDIEIDFSLPRAKMVLNGASMQSVNDTNNLQTTVNNAFWIHTTDGNVDFDEIELQGVFNGFNIKIYSA